MAQESSNNGKNNSSKWPAVLGGVVLGGAAMHVYKSEEIAELQAELNANKSPPVDKTPVDGSISKTDVSSLDASSASSASAAQSPPSWMSSQAPGLDAGNSLGGADMAGGVPNVPDIPDLPSIGF